MASTCKGCAPHTVVAATARDDVEGNNVCDNMLFIFDERGMTFLIQKSEEMHASGAGVLFPDMYQSVMYKSTYFL